MKKSNKLWIPITAIVVSLVVIAAILLPSRIPRDPVAVYAVNMVGYTDYYSGSAESYGVVTTDKVQTLYVTGTQTVTEILVYPGQEVKKGDLLYTYDTTLSDLAIERKDLAIQQLEVELKTAQAELAALKKMKPIQYKPGSSSNTKTDYSKSPADKSKLDTVYSTKTTGLASTSPLYVWLSKSTQVDDAMIERLFDQAKGTPSRIYVVFQTSPNNRTDTTFDNHIGICFSKNYEYVEDPTEPPTPPTETTEPSTETTEPPSESTDPPSESSHPSEPPVDPSEPSPDPSEPSSEPSEPSQPTEEPAEPQAAASVELQTRNTPAPVAEKRFTGYSMTFFTPPSAPKEDDSTIEWNDGYTSAELTAMKAEKDAQIKQLQFDIKMGKAELKIMKKEALDGKVLADFDGVVSEILEPATALETGEPLMKVTGGGGYYVEGTISELALGTIQKGQPVTVNSWDTGMVYTGTVSDIGSYPVEDEGYYYGGGSIVTYYPYTVFIDQSADLQEGYYVSMTYQTAEQAAGILYVQNAFLRSEGNRTYVFVRGYDGLLEKRYLECGVSADGYMTPVYSGLTEEDYVAFPYGSDIAEGVPTFEGTDQDLYGY